MNLMKNLKLMYAKIFYAKDKNASKKLLAVLGVFFILERSVLWIKNLLN